MPISLEAYRVGEWLEIPLSAFASDHLNRSDADMIRAGSHPHEVRQALLALALFPAKWVNRLFSVGGIRMNGEAVQLKAFPAADVKQDHLYRQAREMLDQEGTQQRTTSGTNSDISVLNVPVLYSDDYCIVLDKPAGMPVHASFPGQRGTLDEAAAVHCLRQGDPLPVRHVHRLDEDTSGPVLYSTNDLAQQLLDEQMRSGSIDRKYIALVKGIPQPGKGTINARIGKDRHHRSRRRVSPQGDEAITYYEVAQRFASASLVRLQLETGRTHQIRVHMSHLGHPLIGDELYGGQSPLLSHQALHGEMLVFDHPWNGERMEISSPVPEWFAAVRVRLR